MITADEGGSNGSRCRLWKLELQKFADMGASKFNSMSSPPQVQAWNKIEHRMFSHITHNWCSRHLTSHDVIVQLIANTPTGKGLGIRASIDSDKYPVGLKVSDKEMKATNLKRDKFNGEWNYSIDFS